MVWFIQSILQGALIALRCPHCGRKQLRARKPVHEKYSCKYCHSVFARDDGKYDGRKPSG